MPLSPEACEDRWQTSPTTRRGNGMTAQPDAPDPDDVYANYLKDGAMLGIEPATRERALGLIGEWTEVLTGRPGTTTH